MKKIIVFPANMDLSRYSVIWNLLQSREFSRLRCGLAQDLSETEVNYLREGFQPYCVLAHSALGKKCVEENEEISIEMMEEASYELTRQEVS